MIMVSACLFGVSCKYNGRHNYNPGLCSALKDKEVLLFCPEQAAGLESPRTPSEIQDGTGQDVLHGLARVVDRNGRDLTHAFIDGARNTCKKARYVNAELIILKSRSPSCGVGEIYDGTFSSCLRRGDGVSSALLKDQGFRVVSDEEYLKTGED